MAQNGIKLSAESLECLIWRAEGWAVGTHLAALFIGTHPDPDQFVRRLVTEDR
jgi:ATP/maltotriose-dependent transcriptional regulator MalT